ncbi:hypothetical protein NDU88_002675 [Pleurodeles waltl]|uniref:Uncharacterized protein n=1 Tax=Pleurodeles waltl TaxID=8319 RepID=A0AAV7REP4_PLEWA|nr:hypothetical protein NDU88_002675 [Pleurodeles waltl]
MLVVTGLIFVLSLKLLDPGTGARGGRQPQVKVEDQKFQVGTQEARGYGDQPVTEKVLMLLRREAVTVKVTYPDNANKGSGPVGWCPRGTKNRITCQRKHANEDKQEEEAAGERESENAYEEEEKDAGDCGENVKRETPTKQKEARKKPARGAHEESVTGTVSRARKWKPLQKWKTQTRSARTTPNIEKLRSLQFQDPEAHHVPGGMWPA